MDSVSDYEAGIPRGTIRTNGRHSSAWPQIQIPGEEGDQCNSPVATGPCGSGMQRSGGVLIISKVGARSLRDSFMLSSQHKPSADRTAKLGNFHTRP